MVHFFIFDGDQTADFVKGLGMSFSTPMSDQFHDRHIRFLSSPFPNASASPPDGTDTTTAGTNRDFSCFWLSHFLSIGVWGEAVRVVSGLRRDATAPVLDAQFNGTPTPPLDTWPASVSSELDQLAVC